MKGANAICPSSGSSLSEDRHFVGEKARPLRVPDDDHDYGEASYELTTGQRCSSKMALMNFVRRVHTQHCEEDDQLYRRAALELRRLKSANDDVRDEWILYALAERLARQGHDVDWLRSNLEPVCPGCGGKLKWESSPRGASARCGTFCFTGNYVNWPIRVHVQRAFNAAYSSEALDGPYSLEVL
ncbi:hypothetical protein [Halostella sp. PRR32]|uniref:hypothetical protein n=1 Tax=Halostella sp. PRR32 TaxID=3098147 RepID=UPI002B1DB014|nr:hypothetical protein [Halostella sp. PRR32]